MLRPASAADHDAVWAMLGPVFRAGRTYAIDRDITRADALAYWFAGRAWIAEGDGGLPLGTFYVVRNRGGGGAHYCNAGFVTSPEARGHGVARAMLARALEEARAAGFTGMVFNFVLADNARALDTWQRAGFVVTGRLPGAFRPPDGAPVDALTLFRPL